MEHETVTVDRFIGRMVQHVMPKGFKRIRYYGMQATKTFAKVKLVIRLLPTSVREARFSLAYSLRRT
jgi:hypothetical protein